MRFVPNVGHIWAAAGARSGCQLDHGVHAHPGGSPQPRAWVHTHPGGVGGAPGALLQSQGRGAR